MSKQSRNRVVPFVAVLALVTLSITLSYVSADDSKPADTNSASIESIHGVMKLQSEAWNRGDIDSFMVGYWNSPELTFSSGGTTQRGWIATRDRYKAKYSNKAAMGTLTFTDLETKLLGESVALTLGRWHLKRDEPAQGNFSLVWQKIDGQWQIIHDHSSLLAP